MEEDAGCVLRTWFGDGRQASLGSLRKSLWFVPAGPGRDAADMLVADSLGELHARAALPGEGLDAAWAGDCGTATARQVLALVLLLDQCSRHLERLGRMTTAQVAAATQRAARHARAALARGLDADLRSAQFCFLLMPLRHVLAIDGVPMAEKREVMALLEQAIARRHDDDREHAAVLERFHVATDRRALMPGDDHDGGEGGGSGEALQFSDEALLEPHPPQPQAEAAAAGGGGGDGHDDQNDNNDDDDEAAMPRSPVYTAILSFLVDRINESSSPTPASSAAPSPGSSSNAVTSTVAPSSVLVVNEANEGEAGEAGEAGDAEQRLFVSLSGGVDSMVIARVLAHIAKHGALSDPRALQRAARQQQKGRKRGRPGEPRTPLHGNPHAKTRARATVRTTVHALHIDYGNRAESAAEAAFVRRYCARLGVECHVKRIDEVRRGVTARDAYEKRARQLRFDFYREHVRGPRGSPGASGASGASSTSFGDPYAPGARSSSSGGASGSGESGGSGEGGEGEEGERGLGEGVMVGHHQGDVQENVLSNAMKGCGVMELSGMKNTSEVEGVAVWRPVLALSKAELLLFAHRHGVPYFRDSTPKWSTRAKLRDGLLPAVAATYGAGFGRNLSALAAQSDELHAFLERTAVAPFLAAVRFGALAVSVPLEGFLDHPFFFWRHVLRRVCHAQAVGAVRDRPVKVFAQALNERSLPRHHGASEHGASEHGASEHGASGCLWVTLKQDMPSFVLLREREPSRLFLFRKDVYRVVEVDATGAPGTATGAGAQKGAKGMKGPKKMKKKAKVQAEAEAEGVGEGEGEAGAAGTAAGAKEAGAAAGAEAGFVVKGPAGSAVVGALRVEVAVEGTGATGVIDSASASASSVSSASASASSGSSAGAFDLDAWLLGGRLQYSVRASAADAELRLCPKHGKHVPFFRKVDRRIRAAIPIVVAEAVPATQQSVVLTVTISVAEPMASLARGAN